MLTTTWTLTIDQQKHTVCLKQSILGTRREVWVDGSRVPLKKKNALYGSRDFITIDGREFEVDILTDGWRYFRYLMDGAIPILSDKDIKAGKSTADLLRQPLLRDLPFWNDLSRILGLPYQSIRDVLWPYRHRLLGLRSGYLVVVQKTIMDQNKMGWYVLVHHEYPPSPETGLKIRSDPRIAVLLEKHKKRDRMIESGEGFSAIILPEVKNETASELAVRVQSFLSAVSGYARPLPEGVCENPGCAHPDSGAPRWIMMDGNPRYLCPGCISEIPAWGQQAEEAYTGAPGNLAQGLLVGVGAALLVAVLVAAFALLLPDVIGLLALMAFPYINYEMNRAGAKPSPLNQAVTVLLSVASITMGVWFARFLDAIRIDSPLSIGTLIAEGRKLIAEPRALTGIVFITLIGATMYLLPLLIQQRKQKAQAFHPEVEEIQGIV